MYFQWRQGQAGSERFHSALVPHAGEDTRVYREVSELGALLKQHPEISQYETEKAQIAIVYDYEQFWALMQANMPTEDLSYPETVAKWYRALWELGLRVDYVHPDATAAELSQYKLVLMPMVHMLSDKQETEFTKYAQSGGNLVVGYFSNISDRTLRVKLGGYGGNLVKEVIGVYVEEFYPLRPEQTLKLSNGYEITLWSELSRLNGAEMVASFQGSDVDGSVAIAKRDLGTSTAWYQGTELTLDSQKKFFSNIAADLGIKAEGGVDTEVVHRGPYRFEINHGKNSVEISKN
jgi:beta-galactosidase